MSAARTALIPPLLAQQQATQQQNPYTVSSVMFESRASGRVRLTIPPQLAEQWLATRNSRNRPMREHYWTRLGVDMLEGRWKYNGDSIRFDANGVLMDGQHRLRACAESGVPLDTDVVFGLEPEVMDTIDAPMVRSAGDAAHLHGVQYADRACSLALLVLLHRKHGIGRLRNTDLHPTKTEIINAVRNDSRLTEIAGRFKTLSGRCYMSPRASGFCYYIFSEQDQPLADRFFAELSGQVETSIGGPVHQLRERLIANLASRRKMQPLEVLAITIKAWNAFRTGRTMKLLRWSPDAESFPEI